MTGEITLNRSAFANAVQRLSEGLARYNLDKNDTQIRDGLIQRFEFTYEISHKIIRRYPKSTCPTPGEFDNAEFHYLIRSASERELLLGDWTSWKRYREIRSKTSCSYNEEIAFEVVAEIPSFLSEVQYLVDQLDGRLL